MKIERKVEVLQITYAAVLADGVLRMGREGILQKVTAEKRQEQMLTGKARAEQFGITRPEEVFQTLSEIFDCAKWEITTKQGGFSAEASSCKLCAIAKRMGASSPCNIHCLDPMEGMIKGIAPEAKFTARKTLWSGAKCRVEVSK